MRGLPCRIGGFTPQRTAFQWENETWGEREGGLQLCKVHFHGRKILSIHRPAVKPFLTGRVIIRRLNAIPFLGPQYLDRLLWSRY